MELKYVDSKNLKSLDDYLVALVMGIISLETLQSFHEKSINLGILKEDQECRANTLLWDFKRLRKLYFEQAESVLELLPEGLSIENVIAKLTANEITAAKKLARKPRGNKE